MHRECCPQFQIYQDTRVKSSLIWKGPNFKNRSWYWSMAWALTRAGSIVTLDPRQGQGAKLVRQNLEKKWWRPNIFVSLFPSQINKEIDHPLHSPAQPLNPEHSVDCQFLFFIDHWEIMFTITENIIIWHRQPCSVSTEMTNIFYT